MNEKNIYFDSRKLADAQMTCFEPEADGNLIEGIAFHKFYFDSGQERFIFQYFISK